jgi:hypothetical protein
MKKLEIWSSEEEGLGVSPVFFVFLETMVERVGGRKKGVKRGRKGEKDKKPKKKKKC